jgi:hypothetical protein
MAFLYCLGEIDDLALTRLMARSNLLKRMKRK